VEIVESADPVAIGVPYNYLVTVRNAGPSAGAVQVVMPVTNATISGATSSAFTCTNSAGSATCNATSLQANSSAIITVAVSSLAGGTAGISATTSFGGIDTNPANRQRDGEHHGESGQ
jgi:hypothetical protein